MNQVEIIWNDAKRRNGWNPSELLRKQFMILSTSGGIRNEDGETLALGLHTGHFELRYGYSCCK